MRSLDSNEEKETKKPGVGPRNSPSERSTSTMENDHRVAKKEGEEEEEREGRTISAREEEGERESEEEKEGKEKETARGGRVRNPGVRPRTDGEMSVLCLIRRKKRRQKKMLPSRGGAQEREPGHENEGDRERSVCLCNSSLSCRMTTSAGERRQPPIWCKT